MDTDEQPGEEVHKMGSRRVPSVGASAPMELGCVTLPAHGRMYSPTWKLVNCWCFCRDFLELNL